MTLRVGTGMLVLGALLVAGVAAQQVVETVHLTITGAPNAGTHDAQGMRGGCSAGLEGPGSWGNQLSSTQGDANAFNSLQLSVPDAKAAASGTSQFLLTVGFGPLMKRSATYTVETRAGKPVSGKGTVTIKDTGATAIVSFNAETAQGVTLVGTIDCKKVLRAQ